jgi:coiled-coil domain-containing protein 55
MQRALEQDPTVYQYDEIYDKIEEKKTETRAMKKDHEKKVQDIYIHYIHTLWAESASKLYQLSDRRLSAKLVPTFADRGVNFSGI